MSALQNQATCRLVKKRRRVAGTPNLARVRTAHRAVATAARLYFADSQARGLRYFIFGDGLGAVDGLAAVDGLGLSAG